MDYAIALVHEEEGRFGISFPDFPGAVTAGGSFEEAMRRGVDILAFHIDGMVADGEELPRLRSLAELRRDADFAEDAEGAVVSMVPVELPGKAVRVNVSFDERLLNAIDRAAGAAGETRSAYLAESAKRRLAG